MRTNFWLFGLVFALFSTNAKAQDSTKQLDNLVIHENRIPTPFSQNTRCMSIITKQQILESNATNLNEILAYTSGVDLRQRGPNGMQADVGIRGGSFDQTLVLINGMKISDPQ
ncbi:MAG: TonB-dependent receptor, partial [Bacteroidetes bacterium]|nr:TonB-dependent receptor [Bacteroidota bacterium]